MVKLLLILIDIRSLKKFLFIRTVRKMVNGVPLAIGVIDTIEYEKYNIENLESAKLSLIKLLLHRYKSLK